MNRWFQSIFLVILLVAAAPGFGATLWTGPTVQFEILPGSDPTQATNQDRLTANIWLTRGTLKGIYNIHLESQYEHYFSPQDTEWSFGYLSNYNSLTYTNWEIWAANRPPDTVGRDAVVHLVSEDVYLALKFTSWSGPGGGMAYERSTPTPGPPMTDVLMDLTGTFRFRFTNAPGGNFPVLATTNFALPQPAWPVIGTATEAVAGSGVYSFADPGARTNFARRFYRVRFP